MDLIYQDRIIISFIFIESKHIPTKFRKTIVTLNITIVVIWVLVPSKTLLNSGDTGGFTYS